MASLIDPLSLELDKCAPEITRLLGELQETNECAVEKVEAILNMLKDAQLCTRKLLHPRFVGIDMRNRNGVGLDAMSAHQLGCKLLGRAGTGFVISEVEHTSLCAQLPPDGTEREEQVKFNRDITDLAEGMCAELWHIEYTAGGSTHATAFVNALDQCCKTPIEELQDANGNLNKQMLVSKSAGCAEGLSVGWYWWVIDYRFIKMFPTFMTVAQEVKNAPAQLQMREPEVQVLRKIDAEATRQRANVSVDWDMVEKYAARSKPPCLPYIPAMVAFCKLFCGDNMATHLQELDEYVKSCNYGNRQCLGPMYQALHSTKLGGAITEATLFRFAIIKTVLTAPSEYVDKNGSVGNTAFSSSDVAKLGGSTYTKDVVNANVLMQELRLACKAKVDRKELARKNYVRMVGMCDVRIVLHVAGRVLKGRAQFKSLHHICSTCIEQINENVNAEPIPNPYKELAEKWEQEQEKNKCNSAGKAKSKASNTKTPHAVKAVAEVDIYARDELGNLADPSAPLRAAGFVVGEHVKDKLSGETLKIVHISDKEVKLEHEKFKCTQPVVGFENKFCIIEIAVVTPLTGTRKHPRDTIAHQTLVLKGQIAQYFGTIVPALSSQPLQVYYKPKKVVTTRVVAAGELQLYPLTSRIVVHEHGDKTHIATKHPECTIETNLKPPRVATLQSVPMAAQSAQGTAEEYVNPYWFVTTSPTVDGTNMCIRDFSASEALKSAPMKQFNLMKGKLPVMSNTRELKEGEELVLFVEKRKQAHAMPPSDIGDDAAKGGKRPRAA